MEMDANTKQSKGVGEMIEKDPDQLIIEALRSGQKDPEMLKKKCVSAGLSPSTYGRHRAKLLNQGIIREQKAYYELSSPPLESSEIQELINDINIAIAKHEWDLCISTFILTGNLCRNNRIGHNLSLLNTLKECVRSPDLLQNQEARGQLALIMQYVLRNEINYGSPKNVAEIQSALLDEVCMIAAYQNLDIATIANVFNFLENTPTPKAVDAIIGVISRVSDNYFNTLEWSFHSTLFESPMAKKQGRYIRGKLKSLLSSGEKQGSSRAKRLLQ